MAKKLRGGWGAGAKTWGGEERKTVGRITVGSCLDVDAGRLTINVIKAHDLPKYGISDPPDPCVKITVKHNGKVETKKTRTLKKVFSPVYKEAVMFLVSTTHHNINTMEITMGVHDMARMAGKDGLLIGKVYLGILATDLSEVDQWKSTMYNPGKEFKGNHQLKL